MSIIRIEKNRNYSVLSNIPLNDKNLSWEASGMMAYLLSKPDNWQVRMTDLENQRGAGKGKVHRIFKELQTAGYVTRIRTAGAGGKFTWITTIHEMPQKEEIEQEENKVDTIPLKPIDGKPIDIVNTESINTESICNAPEKHPVIADKCKPAKKVLSPEEKEIANKAKELVNTFLAESKIVILPQEWGRYMKMAKNMAQKGVTPEIIKRSFWKVKRDAPYPVKWLGSIEGAAVSMTSDQVRMALVL